MPRRGEPRKRNPGDTGVGVNPMRFGMNKYTFSAISKCLHPHARPLRSWKRSISPTRCAPAAQQAGEKLRPVSLSGPPQDPRGPRRSGVPGSVGEVVARTCRPLLEPGPRPQIRWGVVNSTSKGGC
jgi:hypothetical protein